MKHASCRLQNQEGSHPQRDSLATCLGGNITSPSSWVPWPSAPTGLLGVVVMWGMEGTVLIRVDITSMLEVGDLLMEAPSFQAVADSCELLVFMLNLCGDGALVGLELGVLLVVMLVSLNFCRGCEVEIMDYYSQGEEGGPCGLEELLAPVRHGVEFPL
jgi:hypothetical protein